MLRVNILLLCVGASAIATAAVAGSASSTSASAQPVTDAAVIDVIAKKLCKAEPIVGTRIPVARRCETPAQLRQFQAQAREMIENHRQRTPCLMGMEVGEGQAMPC